MRDTKTSLKEDEWRYVWRRDGKNEDYEEDGGEKNKGTTDENGM